MKFKNKTIFSLKKIIPMAFVFLGSFLVIGISIHILINYSQDKLRADILDKLSGSGLIEEISLSALLYEQEYTREFLLFTIGVLMLMLMVILALFSIMFYRWGEDRRKLDMWRDSGFAFERLELLEANRIRLNNTEIHLNKTQFQTLKKLIKERINGKALHSADLSKDHGTQMIKRLREELGGKMVEKNFIINYRGQGYWVDIDPGKIKFFED